MLDISQIIKETNHRLYIFSKLEAKYLNTKDMIEFVNLKCDFYYHLTNHNVAVLTKNTSMLSTTDNLVRKSSKQLLDFDFIIDEKPLSQYNDRELNKFSKEY